MSPVVNIIFENVVSFLRDAFGSSTGLVSDLKEIEPQVRRTIGS
jgi:hypothetical protein